VEMDPVHATANVCRDPRDPYLRPSLCPEGDDAGIGTAENEVLVFGASHP
jgi:hypothetical protein